jgi:hypothetical protein
MRVDNMIPVEFPGCIDYIVVVFYMIQDYFYVTGMSMMSDLVDASLTRASSRDKMNRKDRFHDVNYNFFCEFQQECYHNQILSKLDLTTSSNPRPIRTNFPV